jgi:hypothetical protein
VFTQPPGVWEQGERLGFELDLLVEQVKAKAMCLVLSSLLGVEVIERAAIVLVNIVQFDKNVPDGRINALGKSLSNLFKVVSIGKIGLAPIGDLRQLLEVVRCLNFSPKIHACSLRS